MRLFAIPNGSITSQDRAQWMTPPFDLSAAVPPSGPTYNNMIWAVTRSDLVGRTGCHAMSWVVMSPKV